MSLKETPMTDTKTQNADVQNEWPLWEVFVRSRAGLDHKH